MNEEFTNRTGLVIFPEVYETPAITPLPEDAPIVVASGDSTVESTIA